MANREVLIVTGGLTPQVVTETVYALVTRGVNPIVPTKIVCAVTGQVQKRFHDELDAALVRLRRELAIEADWGLRPLSWDAGRAGLFVAVPTGAEGGIVQDIRSDSEAVAFGNLAVRIVRHETADPEARVHLSLAGGRKTMSFHGGAAMSLFGRPSDELSHVLVHPQHFEFCDDFWFRTKATTLVKTRDGSQTFDAKDATVELGTIPFIRVRDWLPRALRDQPLDYGSYVAQINALRTGPGAVPLFLELTTVDCRVRIGDLVDFTLPNAAFALYQLMAEWQQSGYAGADSQGIGPGHRGWLTARMFEYPEHFEPNPVERYLEVYEQTFRVGTERVDRMRGLEGGGTRSRTARKLSPNPTKEKERADNAAYLRDAKTDLVRAIQAHLQIPDLADRFGTPLREVRTKNVVLFGLRLDPREIIIREQAAPPMSYA